MTSIEKILYPITKKEFLDSYWETKHLYISRNNSDYFSELLNINDIDSFLSRNDSRYPSIRLVKNGSELPLNEYSNILNFGRYSSDGLLDSDKIFSQYKDGATILIQLAKSSFNGLAHFCNQLQNDLQSHIEGNIYLTPKNSQGFTTHFDTHSVFVLQLEGCKKWRIYNTFYDLPTLDDTYKENSQIELELQVEIILKPGDILYIPRGLGHDAQTMEGEHSLHVTIGLFPPMWIDIFNYCVKELQNNIEFRKSPTSYIEKNQTILIEEFKKMCLNFDSSVLERSIKNIRNFTLSKQSQLNNNRLKSIIKIDELDINAEVRKIKGLIFEIEKSDSEDEIYISFYDKKITLPNEIEELVKEILKVDSIKISSLIEKYDSETIIDLTKILIEEGLVTLVL
jgi:ribosomal protein L16 Arg81 hydroxylase